MKETKPSYGLLSILMIGAFVAILNNTLFNIALPAIMKDLGISASTVQWLTTGFMLVNGIVIPTTAFLIQKYTVRQLFLTAMGLFAIGTVIGGFAASFPVLLTARLVQALGAAVIMPLLMNVLITSFPPEKRGGAMGVFGLVIIFAPAIGPTLSGWLIEHYHWSVLFYVLLPIVLLVFIFAFFKLHDQKERADIQIDTLSLLLSTIGFGGILYGFSSAGNEGWTHPTVITSIVVGLVFLLFFIWRQFRIETPMLSFRIYRHPIYALSSTIIITIAISMFSVMLILPMYLQNIRGFTPFESGLLMLPGAIIMGLMSPITGKIFDRYGVKVLAITGLTTVLITTYCFTQLSSSTSYTTLVILYSLRMLGISMVMMPIMTTGLNSLPQKDYPHGTAMNSTLQQVSGAFGSSLMISIMSNRAETYAKEMMNDALSKPSSAPVDLAVFKQQVLMDATIKGMDDAFWVATGIALLALILALFIKDSKKRNKQKPITKPVQVVTEEVGQHS